MAIRRVNDQKDSGTRRPSARTPEARENQLIALADSLAERQLRDGTASAQVITHYLKLGSSREKLEQQRLEMEVELMEAKKDQIASAERVESLMKDAINAFRGYSGQDPIEMPDDDDPNFL